MNSQIPAIIGIVLNIQLLLVPVIIFYLFCNIKKLNTKFLWLVHRISAVLLLAVPLMLLSWNIVSSNTAVNPAVSSKLDLPREWVPEDLSLSVQIQPDVLQSVESTPAPGSGSAEDTAKYRSRAGNKALRAEDSSSNTVISNEKSARGFYFLLYVFPFISLCLFLLLTARLIIQKRMEKRLRRYCRIESYRGCRVFRCEEVFSPFSTGIISKKIFMPAACGDQNRDQAILNHEYAHLNGNHNLWSLLENIAVCLYWYNPLCFIFRKNGELLKELTADDFAGKKAGTINYSRILIEEAEDLNRNNNYYLSVGFNKKKILKERITNLMTPQKGTPSVAARVFGILSIIICIASTCFIGCSDKEKISDPDDFSYVNISVLREMNGDFGLPLGENPEEKAYLDNTILMTGADGELILPLRDEKGLSFRYYDDSAAITDTISLPADLGEYFAYTSDSRGRLVVLYYDIETRTGSLERFSEDGTKSQVMRLADLDLQPTASIEIDDEDRLYLLNDNTLSVFRNGKKTGITESREVRSLAVLPEGGACYILWEKPDMINFIDVQSSGISSVETTYENTAVSSSDGKFLVMDSKGIKQYLGETFKGYLTCSEDYPELNGLFTADFVKTGRNIYLTAWDFNSSKLYLYRLQMTDQKRRADQRQALMIQVPSHLYKSMEFAAKTYNRNSEEIRIEVSQYEDYDDNYEAYQRKLTAEILSGKGPDIIYLSSLPWKEFTEKGVLTDLNTFINDDDSFSKDDYLPAMTAAQSESGLYGLALNIYGSDIIFAADSSVMEKHGYSGNYNNISWEEMIKIARQERRADPNGMEIYPFGFPNFEEYSMYYISRLLGNNNLFLDSETGSFNDEGFRSFLNAADELLNGELVKPNISGVADQYRSMEEGSTVFLLKDIGEFWVDLVDKRHLFRNEPVMLVHPNFGTEDLFFNTTLLGINSRCEHQEEAWDFLRTALSKEFQDRMFPYSLPVNRELLRERTVFSVRNTEELNCTFSDDTGDIEYLGAADYSETDLDNYLENVARFRQISPRFDPLGKIIFEQVKTFLSGDQGMDETTEIVSERVNTYISE